jgi:hypothetical protein
MNANAGLSNYAVQCCARSVCKKKVHMQQNTGGNDNNYLRLVGFLCQEIKRRKEPGEGHHERLDKTVINPGTDLTFSRATGF